MARDEDAKYLAKVALLSKWLIDDGHRVISDRLGR